MVIQVAHLPKSYCRWGVPPSARVLAAVAYNRAALPSYQSAFPLGLELFLQLSLVGELKPTTADGALQRYFSQGVICCA